VSRPQRPRRLACLLVGILCLSACSAAAGRAGHRTTAQLRMPPNCRGSFDPYRYSAAALQKCGYRIVWLERVVRLPGGGHAYVYSDGSRQLRPPAGFHPLHATNARLREYGLPPRPAAPAARRRWARAMRRFHEAPPRRFYAVDPYATVRPTP
jgi:hypothetical protein